jgi:two-component system sensor histidine kinase YesM
MMLWGICAMAGLNYLWKKWMDQKIQFKFFVTYLFLAGLPLCIFGVSAYFIAANTLKDKAYSSFTVITKQVNQNIDSYLERLDKMTILPFLDQRIYDALGNAPVPSDKYTDEELQIEDSLQNYFISLEELEEGIKAVYIVSNNGRTYGYSTNSSIRSEIMVDQENWYKEAVKQHGALVNSGLREESQMYSFSDNSSVVSLARYATNIKNRKELGVFVIDVDPYIFNFTAQKPKEGYIIITDQYGNILQSTLQVSKDVIQTIRNQGKPMGTLMQSVQFKNAQGSFVGITSTSEYSGWSTTYLVSTAQLYQDLGKIRLVAWSIIAVLLLFSVIIAGFIAKGVASPIKRLSNLMGKVQHGDLNIQVEVQHKDEIGLLAHSFERMVKQLKHSFEQISVEEHNKRKAEIEMLRAQINPHFIYNTLSAIRMMAIMQNAQEIAKSLEIFIHLMKYCTVSDRKWVAVAEEIRFIQDYVALLESRYMRRFSVNINYANESREEIEQALIMPFIIQPVVENAIFHATGESNNEIRIEIRQGTDSDLIIDVIDQGKGMEPEQVNSLMNFSSKKNGNLSGIGLKNIHERISLEFGVPYGVSIQSALDVGTTVTIRMPRIAKEMRQ